MGDFILVVAPLGAPVAPLFETCTQQGSKSGFKIAKVLPKRLLKWQMGLKYWRILANDNAYGQATGRVPPSS